MRSYSATDLANRTGDVLAVAAVEAVDIRRHGKSRFVILNREAYDRLIATGDPRQAVRVADLDAAEADRLIAALTAHADESVR